jgi:hypothetical protein
VEVQISSVPMATTGGMPAEISASTAGAPMAAAVAVAVAVAVEDADA